MENETIIRNYHHYIREEIEEMHYHPVFVGESKMTVELPHKMIIIVGYGLIIRQY